MKAQSMLTGKLEDEYIIKNHYVQRLVRWAWVAYKILQHG